MAGIMCKCIKPWIGNGLELQIVRASSHGCYTWSVVVGIIDISATNWGM
jgi:hypothetical protein